MADWKEELNLRRNVTERDTALPEDDALLFARRRNSIEMKGREASMVALKALLSNSRSLDEMANYV